VNELVYSHIKCHLCWQAFFSTV